MTSPIPVSDAERRARLVARHHLGRTAAGVTDAVHGVVALHSTDPATPYLASWARVPGFATADLDRALLEERSLWRLHAMRRTLFVVPAAEAPVFEAAASRDVARRERRRLEGWLAAEPGVAPVADFVAHLERGVLEALADGEERRTQELAAVVPGLATQVTLGSGRWATRSPISSRILFLMAMDGRIVRTRPAGSWRSSQYHWAAADRWFADSLHPLDPGPARTHLARRYLVAHGPATLDDLRWWTGWTVKHAAAAVAGIGAVPVRLDDGREGLLLNDDIDPVPAGLPSVALLPALDSTPMGWKHRGWFLGSHAPRLFDRNGNVGPSVWVDGRIVGGWAQTAGGEVAVRLLEDVGADGGMGVASVAAELTTWLGGTLVIPRFRTPLEKELADRRS
jgi:hypothetical protein